MQSTSSRGLTESRWRLGKSETGSAPKIATSLRCWSTLLVTSHFLKRITQDESPWRGNNETHNNGALSTGERRGFVGGASVETTQSAPAFHAATTRNTPRARCLVLSSCR